MLTTIVCVAVFLSGTSAQPRDYDAMWRKFKAEHGKLYSSNGEDEDRFQVFRANVDIIEKHNAKASSYEFGLNPFADLTADEFAAIYIGGYRPDIGRIRGFRFPNVSYKDVPEATDWVSSGAVTSVKNQGSCGSCWAFSTTGAVEGALFVASQKLVSLSEENLVECDKGDSGCKGGLMDHAFDWVAKSGLCSEDAYPYTAGGGRAGVCHFPKCQPVVTIEGFVDVTSQDEQALQAAVAQQPVSVGIEADKSTFQLYRRGVLDNPGCGQSLDHGVLVVGYGTDDGKAYWKVKNSWGPSWGEQGFIRIARGNNMCGIAMQPSYPKGAKFVGPAPGPSPPPPPPPTSHYGNPKNGCMDDEEAIQITDVPGGVCAAHCSIFKWCPSDGPAGVTAKPSCALTSSEGNFCALVCNPAADDNQCGEGASCKAISSRGVCTYDDDMNAPVVEKSLILDARAASEIVI